MSAEVMETCVNAAHVYTVPWLQAEEPHDFKCSWNMMQSYY